MCKYVLYIYIKGYLARNKQTKTAASVTMGNVPRVFQSVSSSTSVVRAPFNRALWWRTTRCGKWATTEKCQAETRWKRRFTPTGPSGRVVSLRRPLWTSIHPPTPSVWSESFPPKFFRAIFNRNEVFTSRFIFNHCRTLSNVTALCIILFP